MLGKALFVVMVMGGAVSIGAKDKPATQPAGGQMDAEMQAMMAKYMEFATPGPEHEHLGRLVGTWNVAATMWTAPGAPPSQGKATARFEAILGGRYVVQHYEGEFMGMPFQGMGIDGYDKYRKKYFSTWIDSMSTSFFSMLGDCDEKARRCAYFGRMDDPAKDAREQLYKAVTHWEEDGSHGFAMYSVLPGGEEFKMMEAIYTRAE